jgi:hypothetical protein
MANRWKYVGDTNLEYGGLFIEFSEWKYGYVNAVQVDDIGDNGFPGAVIVESKSISIDDIDSERTRSALSTIGAKLIDKDDIDDNGHVLTRNTLAWKWCLAYAMNAYDAADVDRAEIVQLDYSEPVTACGWGNATRARSIRSFVRKNFLGFKR